MEKVNNMIMKKAMLFTIIFAIICILSGTAFADSYMVATDLQIRAVIDTVEKGPVDAVWQKGGEATTSRGDRVIWGHFYASPLDVTWGSVNNPDLFVKIWFDVSGRVDVNFFHVSVPDITVYSDYPFDGTVDEQGTTTMSRRYIRQYYEGGQSNSEDNYEDGLPASGYLQTGNPVGYSTANNLGFGSMINTVEKGPVEAVWRFGGQDTTARGDQVIWGHFYASPTDVAWGSSDNPDLYVKIWFDVSGRIDVNYFHVSVPDIEVYSDYPNDGLYDQTGTTIMADRYIRHEFWSGPVLEVTPPALDFGAVTIGNSPSLAVTVQNTGDGTINVTGVTGPSVPYSMTNGCVSAALLNGQTCTITIQFTPTAVGPFNDSLQVNTDAGNQTVNITGTGQTSSPAQILVTPTTVNFGTVTLGSSTTSNVQVQNIGTSDLNVTFVGNFSPSAFSLDSNGCTSPVAPGNTCDISVRFTPTISTAYSGSFEINSNGGNQIVNLTGIGQAIPTPQISVSPTNVNFGTVNLGTSTTSNVQVQNIGTGDLNVTFVGSFTPTEFSLNSNGCTSPLSPGNTCNISVRFTPTADTTYNGSFQINSNGGNQTVNLNGTGQTGGGGGNIDLEPTYIRARAPYLTYIYRGTTRVFDYKVRNNGSDPSGTIRIKAYYSLEDEVLDGSDMEIANFTISSIGGGAESSLVLSTVTPWNLQVHSVYYLILVVDPDDTIQETNEDNNTITHGGLVKG